MCGIVAYVGSQPAAPILVEGLRKLEYRGYDSAGVGVDDGHDLTVVRVSGKLARLAAALEQRSSLQGTTGIGHTRWATHGRPSEANAHPQVAGPVAVVHNGIVENHAAIRRDLEAEGVAFSSETDTESIAQLIHRELRHGASSLLSAVHRTTRQLHGTYAIAAMSRTDPRAIVAARQGAPLVLGIGDGEVLCGSDIPALSGRTPEIILLEDGDVAELRPTGVRIVDATGAVVARQAMTIDWSDVRAERGGYKHFMLKEIHEQPRVVGATLHGRIDLAAGDVSGADAGVSEAVARVIRRVCFIACGTSHHAGIAGRYWMERLARVPSVVELASEVRNRSPVFGPEDLVVAISQSGETADTLGAVREARAAGAHVLAVSNVVGSALARVADGSLFTCAGPEIGVASTKCFTTQLAALLLLAVYVGRRRGSLSRERALPLLRALSDAPSQMQAVLADPDGAHAVGKRLVHATDALFLGRGLGFPIALEGALKLKELSYSHAEGYAAGELKHGPIALIDSSRPVVAICPRDGQYEKMLSNIQEVLARDGHVIAIATRGDEAIARLAEHVLWIPSCNQEVLPLLTVLPLQLLAYAVADLRGNDVDQPRNLAKSVTVE